MTITLTHRRFSDEEFARIGEAGIFPDARHLALRDGIIYAPPAPGGLPQPRRFTAAEYQLLGEIGVLHEDDHFELIEGEIVEMAAMGHRHNRCVDQLSRLLHDVVPRTYFVRVQGSIRLFGHSEPEPDIALVYDRGPDVVATEADVPLVIEVSDSTLVEDRKVKLPLLYARAGIPETWLVDVKAGMVERHTEPRDGRYTQRVTARAGETLASTVIAAVVIPVADILR